MLSEYAMVHVTYNLPLAVSMTGLYWPFLNRLDVLKVFSLVTISVAATTPWDSYLVRNKIWTYPEHAVSGYTIFSIPLEEVFFFIIQTYNTGMIYTIITRRLVLPSYLQKPPRALQILGGLILGSASLGGVAAFMIGDKYTYIGLTVAWACSWLLFQWVFASNLILNFPRKELVASVMIPTVLLWVVDTLSLGRGTWAIENSTKLDIQIWGKLELEEAVFFFLSNIMIVNGLVAADYAIAMLDCQKAQSIGDIEEHFSIRKALTSFIAPEEKSRTSFVTGLRKSVQRLAISSQSMYMGSAMFQGPLRIDLIFLYSFCRIADDLVDASSAETAETIIEQCGQLLEAKFASPTDFPKSVGPKLQNFHGLTDLIEAIDYLPVSRLRIEPLQGLLEGFKQDLQFNHHERVFPISSEAELEDYAYHVAGTVGLCVLDLIFHHFPHRQFATEPSLREKVREAGCQMGKALQYINIARDIGRDAAIDRVYLPTTWLKEAGISPEDVVFCPSDPRVDKIRSRVLLKAKKLHDQSENAIRNLPREVQGPLHATVKSYMEIGVALEHGARPCRPDHKLRLSIPRRLVVVYKAMASQK